MYHCHTDNSLLDSCSKPEEYIRLALDNGMNAISFSEHGKPLQWVSKKIACDAAGLKYMHSVEIYLTRSLSEKVRDNYHTVLIAKNYDGLLELNRLVSMSCDREHFYYTNRMSFDEFLNLSPNIISTSACLASPLNKLSQDDPYYEQLVKKYDYLEVQPHLHPDQIAFNKRLMELADKFGKPLIAGTDTHSSSAYKAECRAILLAAKRKNYGDEDTFDLSFKTYDELCDMFSRQSVLPDDIMLDAINNTNLMADSVEEFKLDRTIKYPILYGSKEEDDRRYSILVDKMFAEKLDNGVIQKEQEQAYRDAIDEEMAVLRKLGMTGFMLSMSEIVSWCRNSGMAIGTARGSVGGSRVAYITDIIDMNPETWGTMFSRFANEDRVEVGDIDTDCVDTDRPAIFNHIIEKFGKEKTARVASFGTIQEKGVIDDVGRALATKWKDTHPESPDSDNPWSLKNVEKIKSEFDKDPDKTKKKYDDLFYYFDGLLGTKISQSIHPAGMVISPVTLNDRYGTFDKDGDICLMIDMDEAHDAGLTKYDFLVLKSVKVIRDICNYIGIKYPKSHEIDFDDIAVWEDLERYQDAIFQFESPYSAECLKKFKARSIFDMSLVTAAIRPSGASYRDDLLKRKIHKNPSELIDELLKNNNGLTNSPDIQQCVP